MPVPDPSYSDQLEGIGQMLDWLIAVSGTKLEERARRNFHAEFAELILDV